MTPEGSIALVLRYYEAFRADTPAATASALEQLLDPTFSLESPLVDARFGGAVTGATARSVAAGAAPFLKNAHIDRVYSTLAGDGVAALITFPSPVGNVVQSEHFDLAVDTATITRLRSYYDPRKLLSGG